MPCQPARPFVRRVRIACIAAMLTGCTVGPDFTPPAAPTTKDYVPGGLPALATPSSQGPQQHFVPGAAVSGAWWDLFHSPKLSQVLTQALADSPTLAAAEATLRQAREQQRQAQGALFPQADLSANAARQRTSLLPEGINTLGPIDNLFSIGPSVSYALDIFGLNRRRVEQQEALATYQEYQLDGAYLTLTGNAVRQAIAIASARAQIAALDRLIADDQRNLDLVRREFAVRNKTVSDVEAARSQLASDRALLPPLRQQLSLARDALALLVGKSPGDWAAPDLDMAEFALPQSLPVSVPSELVRQRPDVLAAQAQLHAASAVVGVATAQLYPNLTLTGALTQEALQTSTLFTSSATAWSIAAGITAPLFHGGALTAQKRGAEDAYGAAFANYRQTVLQSFVQVADVLQALDHDTQLVAAQQAAVASSQAALGAARDSYSYGEVEVLQVLDAQRQLEQARLGAIRAAAQRYVDSADLFGAMGGGWQTWRAKTAAAAAPR
jgi:NodT family efflux transporter outer membrane factor (OMF) lipoprotein